MDISRIDRAKTGERPVFACLKENMKKGGKNKIKKWLKKALNGKGPLLTWGNINPGHTRMLTLILAIIFMSTVMVAHNFSQIYRIEEAKAAPVEINKNAALEKEINKMVKGYPIQRMTPYIAVQDPKVAAFLVAIAKKESAWGKHSPVLGGKDCYNYWGFRLKTDKMGSGGHTCFDSPKQAVETVAGRIDELVNEESIDTPKEMVIWKCGYDCNGPEALGAKKWIKDVDYYYKQMVD